MGPLPGTKWDPSLGQTGLSLFNSTVKSPFCPVCPWTGGGSSLGRLSREGRQKNVYVLCVYCFFFVPKELRTEKLSREFVAPTLVEAIER